MTKLGVHVVKPGEDLFRIARRYGVTWSSIWHWTRIMSGESGLRNPNLLHVGEKLYIPEPGMPDPSPGSPIFWRERWVVTGRWEYWEAFLNALDQINEVELMES